MRKLATETQPKRCVEMSLSLVPVTKTAKTAVNATRCGLFQCDKNKV